MRDKWYGDNRDLIKWGILLELGRSYGSKHILQVLYYRPTVWAKLEVDGKRVSLNFAVIEHFRSASSIKTLRRSPPIETIETVSEDCKNRIKYQNIVLDKIRSRVDPPGIVLLDPDTGLQPKSGAGATHVSEKELAEIWKALLPRDVLVLYQHKTNRNGSEWIPEKKEQFETALGIKKGAAKLGQSKDIANDVAFFYARKGT